VFFMDDIVITGIGIISACGVGREAFWQSCREGKSGISSIQSFDTSPYQSHLGAEARDFNPKDFIPPLKYRRMSRVSRMAVAASIEALKDSGLEVNADSALSIGAMVGTGYGSTSQTDEFFAGMLKEGPEGANPSLFPDTVPNAPASQVSIYHGLKGPNVTFSHNEVSGEQAMICAARLLQEDRAEAFLVGSVDELSPVLFHSFAVLRALSPQGAGPEGMAPFDRKRNGRILGEGAGVLVLEKRGRARARGARMYGSLTAWASTGGPVGITHYEKGAEQMTRAVEKALKGAGLDPGGISYIHGAANSSRELDHAEAVAIQRVFGKKAGSIPVSSLKGHIGDFCGSFALRAGAVLLAMSDGKIPPTLGLADPEFDLAHVRDVPQNQRIEYALLNGFSFGGSNVCFVIKNESLPDGP
jgi:3-oxoacyl-[acyl-carrier-protein] synthase II